MGVGCLEKNLTGSGDVLVPGQLLADDFDDLGSVRLNAGSESGHHLAMATNEEFLKIPGDVARAFGFRDERCQMFVKGVGALAIDFDFFKQVKRHVVIGRAELANVVGRARFLLSELVAGKSEYCETLLGVVLVQRLQLRVLRSQAALAGNIHDQHHLVGVLLELDVFPL